ncbi:aldehyde dehydrogenase family protein [Paraburkholderia adhaesiva]|uniref:aldehyde dehydrogenase family protein n=1 Tax=Paraburkholderia adhaesiva TaxID=2883244 RepID=UPI001F46071E|nr:aldehyde dehydrogenase family protein [Paraburkholderia adhaesiva]
MGEAAIDVRNYINGRWVNGVTIGCRNNPSDTREVVAEYARADRTQADEAARAAADAFVLWQVSATQRRCDALDQIGGELLARKDELGRLLAREEGKTLPEAVAELVRAGQIFKFFAGEALRIQGETMASERPDVQVDVTPEAVGVFGVIAPWSSPFAVPAWAIAPALAYGNTVIFKSAELAPACGAALAEIISRAQLPSGVFNFLVGSGREVGQALVDSPLVDAISFAGSQGIGVQIQRATAARGARAQLDMGGKNPLIVLADADQDAAVECAIRGAFASAGQRCTASSSVIVESAVHDAFVQKMARRMAALKVGNAMGRGIDIGPVVDESRLTQNQRFLDVARSEGAEHVCGGELIETASPGHYMRPALWLARPQDRIAREEIFGPVAAVLEADDYDHALALANNTPDSRCAGLCTRSLSRAMHFRRHAVAGMTVVNLPTVDVDFRVPVGGRKRSSHGQGERGRYASGFYTTVKTGYMKV